MTSPFWRDKGDGRVSLINPSRPLQLDRFATALRVSLSNGAAELGFASDSPRPFSI